MVVKELIAAGLHPPADLGKSGPLQIPAATISQDPLHPIIMVEQLRSTSAFTVKSI